MTRRIVANLDWEHRLGGAKPLRPRTLAALTAVGSLLRVFARDGDELWSPAPLPGGVSTSTGPAVQSRVGRPPADSPQTLWWCPEVDVKASRSHGDTLDPVRSQSHESPDVFDWPSADGSLLPSLAHRSLAHRLRKQLGHELPGESWVENLAELDAALDRHPTTQWVLKAPWSAAGRDRQIGESASIRKFASQVFARAGGALLEPWLPRLSDHGTIGVVHDDGVHCHGIHDLIVDARGTFRGIRYPDTLEPPQRTLLERTFAAVGQDLADRGFRGPFGIDAFVHERAGEALLCPLLEINPRLSFGFVGRAWLSLLGLESGSLNLAPADRTPGQLDPDLLLARHDIVAWIQAGQES